MGDHRFEYGKHLVGRTVNKKFKGFGLFVGKIVRFNSARGFYKVRYEDGDAEELELEEVKGILMAQGRKRKRGGDETVEKESMGGKETKQDSNPPRALTEQADLPRKGRKRRGRGLNAGPVRRSSRQAAAAAAKNGKENGEGDEGARVSGDGVRRRRRRRLAAKLPLPSSSGDLHVPEESVPALFYVYTTLRSFSKLLFLSPFSLQDFVGALNCEEANSLMDHVHLALLQTLRRHLEFIVPDEGPAAAVAIRCLRHLDWNFLDRITWPVYLIEYLISQGFSKISGQKLGCLKLCNREYYSTSVSMKLTVLEFLCNEVMETEEIRPEISTRLGDVEIDGEDNLINASTSVVEKKARRGRRRILKHHSKEEIRPEISTHIGDVEIKGEDNLINASTSVVEKKARRGRRRILKHHSKEEIRPEISTHLGDVEIDREDNLINASTSVVEKKARRGRRRILKHHSKEEIRPEISTRLGDVEIDGEDNLINVSTSAVEKKARRGRRRILKHHSKESVVLDCIKTDDQGSSISNSRTGVNTIYSMSMVKFQGNSGHIQNKQCETARSEANDVENLNSDECCLCRMDGVLICCDGCPAAYHSRCVGVSKDALPEGDWYCPECSVKKAPRGFAVLKGLQGAEFLGMDPHGRIYFSICGYLLAADSATDPVTTYYYYNKDDSMKVLDILDSSTPLYDTIRNVMVQSWDKSETMGKACPDKADNFCEKCTSESSIISVSHSLVHQEQESASLVPSVTCQENAILKNDSFLNSRPVENFDAGGKEDVEMMDACLNNGDTLIASSESSLEMTSLNVGAQGSEKNHEQQFIRSNARCSVEHTKSCLVQGQQLTEADAGNATFQVMQQAEQSDVCTVCAPGQMVLVDSPLKRQVAFQLNAYENQYILGDVAASAAANLAVNIAENSVRGSSKRSPLAAITEQRKITEQMKAFSKAAAQFSWPCFTKKCGELQKEKCGWCLFCKSSTSNLSGCILHMASEKAVAGALGGVVDFSLTKNEDGHFPDIVAYILYMEDQLYGLLDGPWENPLYRKYWRKYVEQASSIAEVKRSLLELELSIKSIALSADWCKAVDDATSGVSTSQISASVTGQTPKRGRPRRNSLNWCKAVNDATSGVSTSQVSGSVAVHTPKRGRPRKNPVNWCKAVNDASAGASPSQNSASVASQTPKRGRPRKKFVNWFKAVDDATSGVSTSQISASVAGQTPKRGRPRRNSAAAKTSPVVVEATSFGVNWWRGCRLLGRAHCQNFLPYIIARRAGRQAGLRKIPGIFYAEDLEIPRRSKRYAWRAAVEMARNVSQLALQVRIINACIRWNDIVSSEDSSRSKGVEEEGTTGYKKAAICAKSSEKGVIKYLVDFGKQKTIPIHIVKHGIKHEDAEKGKNKYWISENFVPLFLLKEFRKKPVRGRPKRESNKFPKFLFRLSKTSNSDVFSCLLEKAEGRHKCSCGHCKMDVLIWKAVQCQICEGSFHCNCTIPILDSSGCKLICHKCYNIKLLQGDPNVLSEKKPVSAHKCSRIAKESVNGMSSPGRKRKKYKSLQSHKKTEGAANLGPRTLNVNSEKFGVLSHNSSMLVKEPVENGMSLPDKKQKKYKRHHSHSENVAEQKINSITKSLVRKIKGTVRLDGILWKKKRSDELGKEFRQTKLLLPCQSSMDASIKPLCFLCCEAYNSQLIYIGCESCTEWFHGDAFGLTMENVVDLIAFKCHKCRKRSRPACPYAKKNLESKMPEMKIKTDNGEMLDAAESRKPSNVVYSRRRILYNEEPHVMLVSRDVHGGIKMDCKFEYVPLSDAEHILNSIPIPDSQEPVSPKINCASFIKDYLQEQVTNCSQIRKEDDLGETSMGSEMMSGVIDSSIKDYLQDKLTNCTQNGGGDNLRETFIGSEMENNDIDSSFKYYLQDDLTNFLQNGIEDKSRKAQMRPELKNDSVQSFPGFQTQSMLSYMELLASEDDKIENLFDLSQDGVLNWPANLLPVNEAVNGSQLHGLADGPNLLSRATISPNSSEKIQSHLPNTFALESFVNQPYSTGTKIKFEENKMEKCPNCDLKEVPLDLQCRICGTAIHFHCYKLAPTGLWTECGWLCRCCEAGFVQG